MTHTIGKHPTNCAGEYRVGDKIIDHELDDNIVLTLSRIDNEHYYLYHANGEAAGKWHKQDLSTGFTNITEMQRRLGEA